FEVAADPRHLGAHIGFLSVLHTWGQNLQHHPHVHCVIPAGGLSADHTRWIQPRYPFFLAIKVLSRVFRGKFVARLRREFQQGKLGFYGDQEALRIRSYSVLCSAPCFGRTGSFTPSRPSADPNTSCTTWPVTPIVSPSPIIA